MNDMQENNSNNQPTEKNTSAQGIIDLKESGLTSYKTSNKFIETLVNVAQLHHQNHFRQFVKEKTLYYIVGKQENISTITKKLSSLMQRDINYIVSEPNSIGYFFISENRKSYFLELSEQESQEVLNKLTLQHIKNLGEDLYRSWLNQVVGRTQQKPLIGSQPNFPGRKATETPNQTPVLKSTAPSQILSNKSTLDTQKERKIQSAFLARKLYEAINSQTTLDQIKLYLNGFKTEADQSFYINFAELKTGMTAFHKAVEIGRADIIKLLFENGANQNVVVVLGKNLTKYSQYFNWLPIEIAIKQGVISAVRVLLEHPSYQSIHGNRIAQFASKHASEEMKSFLVTEFSHFFKSAENSNSNAKMTLLANWPPSTIMPSWMRAQIQMQMQIPQAQQKMIPSLQLKNTEQNNNANNNALPPVVIKLDQDKIPKESKSKDQDTLENNAIAAKQVPLEKSNSNGDIGSDCDTDSDTENDTTSKEKLILSESTMAKHRTLLEGFEEIDIKLAELDKLLKEYEQESQQDMQHMKQTLSEKKERAQEKRKKFEEITESSQTSKKTKNDNNNLNNGINLGNITQSSSSPAMFKVQLSSANTSTKKDETKENGYESGPS